MIHLHDLKAGDWVLADYEGNRYEGSAEELSYEKVYIRIAFNDHLNWYDPKELEPVPLTEEQLVSFGFVKSTDPIMGGKGEAWIRGPFKVIYPEKNNTQHIILECLPEQPRELKQGLMVHELQHHYHGMTKVFLEK